MATVPPVLVVPATEVEPETPSLVPPVVVDVVPARPVVLCSRAAGVRPPVPVPPLPVLLVPPVLPMRGVLLDGCAPHAATAAESPTRNPTIIFRDDISFSPVRHAKVPHPKRNPADAPCAAHTTARDFHRFRVAIRAAEATFECALQASRVRGGVKLISNFSTLPYRPGPRRRGPRLSGLPICAP